VPSLAILDSAVLVLSCGQKNRQTSAHDRYTHATTVGVSNNNNNNNNNNVHISIQHEYLQLTAVVRGSDVPSLKVLLVAEERMRSSGYLQHWLVTGRASSLKISAPIIRHRMNVLSLHSSSITAVPSPV